MSAMQWVWSAADGRPGAVSVTMKPNNDNKRPNLNTGKPWSDNDVRDLKAAIGSGLLLDEIAVCLGRTEQEVRDKAADLGLVLNE